MRGKSEGRGRRHGTRGKERKRRRKREKKKFFKIVLHKQEEADDADVPKRLSASRGLVTFCVLAVHHVLSGTHSKVHYEACKMVFRIRPPHSFSRPNFTASRRRHRQLLFDFNFFFFFLSV